MKECKKKVKRNPFPEEIVNIPIKECPHCGSKHFIKFGKYVNVSRYRCKKCCRTFIPTSGSSIHYINKKEKFLRLFDLFNTGEVLTIKDISEKFGISVITAFDWRHKIFSALELVQKNYKIMTIANKIVFNFNEKGRKGVGRRPSTYESLKINMCAISDRKLTEIKFVKVGEVEKKDYLEQIGNRIRNKSLVLLINKEKIFDDDITEVLKKREKYFKRITIERRFEDHIAKSENFKRFINSFMRGVATKYLQVYANFYSFLQSLKPIPNYYKLLEVRTAWIRYLKMEELYKDFLKSNFLGAVEYVEIKRRWKSDNIRFNVNFEQSLINNYC
ncbi:MAG TPA: hypothetical protein PK285_07755 [Bacteroidales bacterium]|nr:hypothetical protein [Bacteroidales bacterium]